METEDKAKILESLITTYTIKVASMLPDMTHASKKKRKQLEPEFVALYSDHATNIMNLFGEKGE